MTVIYITSTEMWKNKFHRDNVKNAWRNYGKSDEGQSLSAGHRRSDGDVWSFAGTRMFLMTALIKTLEN